MMELYTIETNDEKYECIVVIRSSDVYLNLFEHGKPEEQKSFDNMGKVLEHLYNKYHIHGYNIRFIDVNDLYKSLFLNKNIKEICGEKNNEYEDNESERFNLILQWNGKNNKLATIQEIRKHVYVSVEHLKTFINTTINDPRVVIDNLTKSQGMKIKKELEKLGNKCWLNLITDIDNGVSYEII